MTVSRRQFEQFLACLKSDHWSVFPAVANADLDPLSEGANLSWGWLMWSTWADQAFEDDVLARPMLLRWHGARWRVQLHLARAGLSGRVVSELNQDGSFPLSYTPGVLVLGPSSDQVCDLSALVEAFSSMERHGIIALPLAGLTPSEGRDDVASARESPSQPSVFWDAQSHRFDDLGMIEPSVTLEWGGNAEPIVRALLEGGFEVENPEAEDRWLSIRSRRQPPDIPTLEEAEAFE